MKQMRTRVLLIGALALALVVTVGLTITDVASAKKKKAGGTVDITKQVNQQVPDATAPSNHGVLTSTIEVGGKKFKKTRIRDVNVTLQTTGSADLAATQLEARLSAPNGMTTSLFNGELLGQSIGPLTLDDESPNNLGGTTQPDSTTLPAPYAGTAQPDCFFQFGVCTFWPMDDGPVTGTWTLRVYDLSPSGPLTSVLDFWRLHVVAGRPYKTK